MSSDESAKRWPSEPSRLTSTALPHPAPDGPATVGATATGGADEFVEGRATETARRLSAASVPAWGSIGVSSATAGPFVGGPTRDVPAPGSVGAIALR